MQPDEIDFEALMQGEGNNGREKGEKGGWVPLETWENGVDSSTFYAEVHLGVRVVSVKKYPELKAGPVHGTSTMYIRRKCRCAECRAWNAARSRQRRNNGKKVGGLYA